MSVVLFLVLLFIPFNSYSNDEYYDNFFESLDYVVVLRFSSMYSSHKLVFERAIEGSRKLYIDVAEFEKIKKLNTKTIEFISKIYDSYKDTDIKSQINQIRLEIELLSLQADKIISDYKNYHKYFYASVVDFEKKLYRIEIYLKGLSNRLSNI